MKLDLRIESITLDELSEIIEILENRKQVVVNDGERISEGRSLGQVLYAEISPNIDFPDRAEITRQGITATYHRSDYTPDHCDGF